MENTYYNQLIKEGEQDKLLYVLDIYDLIKYKYHGKYLLEYLLEKGEHNYRTDFNARTTLKWMNLYIKYNLLEPLLDTEIDMLLKNDGNELVLDKLLKVFNDEQRIKLYQNLKKSDYWKVICNESLFIKYYKKYNIELPEIFVPIPTLNKDIVSNNTKLEELLTEFKNTFNNLDNYTLEICMNELRRKAKIDKNRTFKDIRLLIAYKKNIKKFKIVANNSSVNYYISDGYYQHSTNKILINNYDYGVFNHELSHMIYNLYEKFDLLYPKNSDTYFYRYIRIQKEIKNNCKDKIIDYIKNFHHRYNDMSNYFLKLYFAQIIKKYGNYISFICDIYNDIKDNNISRFKYNNDYEDHIKIENENDVIKAIKKITKSHTIKYIHVLLSNYYSEELYLENLLDALLDGGIYDNKVGIKCLSGHGKKYFKTSDDLSFNEVLANYDAIINSYHGKVLIKKLRSLVGDELVDMLDEYFNWRKKEVKTYIKYEEEAWKK